MYSRSSFMTSSKFSVSWRLTCQSPVTPGRTVKVTVWRDRKALSVDVVVGRRPKA